MKPSRKSTPPRNFAAHIHLLGCVDYEDCLHVQRRLAYDALTRADGRVSVLLCEHPPLITIGRDGSRGQVHFTGSELAEWELPIRYISRGGGCMLHAPGQLAIYPILSLDWHGWTVGQYLRQLQVALGNTLAELGINAQALPDRCGWWGRTGMLAAVGVAVKQGITSHGAFMNVAPEQRGFARVETMTLPGVAPDGKLPTSPWPLKPSFSSLLSEKPAAAKMAKVRSIVVNQLAEVFGCRDYHLHTGHPLLAELPEGPARESAA